LIDQFVLLGNLTHQSNAATCDDAANETHECLLRVFVPSWLHFRDSEDGVTSKAE